MSPVLVVVVVVIMEQEIHLVQVLHRAMTAALAVVVALARLVVDTMAEQAVHQLSPVLH
jgi:hypothetical protein